MSFTTPSFTTSPPFRISHQSPFQSSLVPITRTTPLTPPAFSTNRPRRATIQAVSTAPPAPQAPGRSPPTPDTEKESPPVQHLHNVKQFLQIMATSAAQGQIVTILFHAKYCRACKYVRTHFLRIAKECSNHKILFIQCEQEEAYELCSRLGVRFLPLIHIYQGGRGKVEDFGWGPSDIHALRRKLNKYISDG